MIRNRDSNEKARLLALLGLAASRPTIIGACPADSQLAAFIEKRLGSRESQAIQNHIDLCPMCYHHFGEITDYLNSVAEVKTSRGGSKFRVLLGKKLHDWFSPWIIAPAVLVIASLLIVLIWPGTALESRIDNLFLTYSANSYNEAAIAKRLPLPWDGSAIAFTEAQPTQAMRAFGAGVWAGQNSLLGETLRSYPENITPPDAKKWSETQWSVYFTFGRWAMVAWVDSQLSKEPSVWDEHEIIIEGLISKFTSSRIAGPDASQALIVLKDIRAKLAQVKKENSPQTRAALNRALLFSIQRLGPKT